MSGNTERLNTAPAQVASVEPAVVLNWVEAVMRLVAAAGIK